MRLIADTTVLVDLWRMRREPWRLVELRRHLTEPMLPWQALFEFARGAFRRGVTEPALRHFLSGFTSLPITERQVMRAATIDASLSAQALTIGSGDVWIAAAALEENLPVLTANVRHFSRVTGVQVISYSILP